MSYSMFSKRLKVFFLSLSWKRERRRRRKPKISLIIPFSSDDPVRKEILQWLLEYWKHELPGAEIIIGRSNSKVFCKGEALNDAVRRSTGKVLAIIDSDAYISGKVINRCADRILEEIDSHLWYVPYRHLYRLTRHATKILMASDPRHPFRFPSPLPSCFYESNGHKSKYGHRYGAMCMMFPRQAYDVLGCFDERFRGWGGEDVALLRALDTLYGKHKTTPNDILHMWHPYIGHNYKTRIWEGQERASTNDELANKYNRATRHPSKMKELVDEGCKNNCKD